MPDGFENARLNRAEAEIVPALFMSNQTAAEVVFFHYVTEIICESVANNSKNCAMGRWRDQNRYSRSHVLVMFFATWPRAQVVFFLLSI
jgi:hypothetical protein